MGPGAAEPRGRGDGAGPRAPDAALTVRPVPSTITSYSSSMVRPRCQRRGLLLLLHHSRRCRRTGPKMAACRPPPDPSAASKSPGPSPHPAAPGRGRRLPGSRPGRAARTRVSAPARPRGRRRSPTARKGAGRGRPVLRPRDPCAGAARSRPAPRGFCAALRARRAPLRQPGVAPSRRGAAIVTTVSPRR